MDNLDVTGGGNIEPRRKPLRLQYFDYSESGIYFITLVVDKRKSLLGEIVDGTLILNQAAVMIGNYWDKLSSKFPGVHPGSYVVMPNHFHGLIEIDRDLYESSFTINSPNITFPSIPSIIQWFKTMTTNEYIKGVKNKSWQAFTGRFWQRNYYEHIVRDDEDLGRLMDYIENNPAQWLSDQELGNI